MNDPSNLPAETETPGYAQEMSTGLLRDLADWIMQAALEDSPIDQLMSGVCVRLLAAGMPLARSHLSYRTLHPSIESVSWLWSPDQPIQLLEHMHGAGSSDIWRRSPFFYMNQNDVPALRRRLTGPAALRDFPILDDLHDEGMTDYLALMVRFDRDPMDGDGRHNGILTSWTTKRPSGFLDTDIQALLRMKQRLGVAAKLAIKNQIATNVVSTYLGPRAGGEVLSGRIQRGDGHSIHAIVWYSDLRGSSQLADTMPAHKYIALLNGYFECAAGSVIGAGGEVLNYIGDGVLAIFPISQDDPVEEAAAAALAAAVEARRRLADVNDNLTAIGAPPLDFGVAMHVGDVVFGNIGAGARLAFTTIGAAVNEVARIEELTKTFRAPVLMSSRFKNALPEVMSQELKSFGPQDLRGIGAPIEIYGMAADATPMLPGVDVTPIAGD